MYYREYKPTCVETLFGRPPQRLMLKCVVPKREWGGKEVPVDCKPVQCPAPCRPTECRYCPKRTGRAEQTCVCETPTSQCSTVDTCSNERRNGRERECCVSRLIGKRVKRRKKGRYINKRMRAMQAANGSADVKQDILCSSCPYCFGDVGGSVGRAIQRCSCCVCQEVNYSPDDYQCYDRNGYGSINVEKIPYKRQHYNNESNHQTRACACEKAPGNSSQLYRCRQRRISNRRMNIAGKSLRERFKEKFDRKRLKEMVNNEDEDNFHPKYGSCRRATKKSATTDRHGRGCYCCCMCNRVYPSMDFKLRPPEYRNHDHRDELKPIGHRERHCACRQRTHQHPMDYKRSHSDPNLFEYEGVTGLKNDYMPIRNRFGDGKSPKYLGYQSDHYGEQRYSDKKDFPDRDSSGCDVYATNQNGQKKDNDSNRVQSPCERYFKGNIEGEQKESMNDILKLVKSNVGQSETAHSVVRNCNCEYAIKNELQNLPKCKYDIAEVMELRRKLDEALSEIRECRLGMENDRNKIPSCKYDPKISVKMLNDCRERCTRLEGLVTTLDKGLENADFRHKSQSKREHPCNQYLPCYEAKEIGNQGRNGIHGMRQNGRQGWGGQSPKNQPCRERNFPKQGAGTGIISAPAKDTAQRNVDKGWYRDNDDASAEIRQPKTKTVETRGRSRERKHPQKGSPRNERSNDMEQPKEILKRKVRSVSPGRHTDAGGSRQSGGACYHIKCFPPEQVYKNPTFMPCRTYGDIIQDMKNKRNNHQ